MTDTKRFMGKAFSVVLPLMLTASITTGLMGCKDLTGSQELPAGTTNPSFYNTKEGALLERNAAMLSFFRSLAKYVVDAGLITDELQDANTGASAGILLNNKVVQDPLDERILAVSSGSLLDGSVSYGYLQATRGFTSQALGMLAKYDTAVADLESQKIVRAELYALTGYSEVMLADLFCSGVPLSTLDFERDYTYRAGSSTVDVYKAAIAQFDTALMLADTSTKIRNLARVGQGRAWLDLGQYAAAADDVQSVPDEFAYQISLGKGLGENLNEWVASGIGTCGGSGLNCWATVSDREGVNGLPFMSSGDPRSAATFTFVNTQTNDSMYFPLKYNDHKTSDGTLTFTVASGVEARLIQAEHALQAGDPGWITILKTLHDTLPGVTPLADPGSDSTKARVALLFKERAEWLYLTGSRQGDLRRLLRQYSQYWGNSSDQVYPTGVYLAPGSGRYGKDVTAPIPQSENVNPLFHGCLNRAP